MTKLTDALTQQLLTDPQRPLIKSVDEPNWITKGEFRTDVMRIMSALTNAKIGHLDQVLVCLDNSIAYPELMQAFWTQGVVVHPVSASTPAAQLLTEWQEQNYVAMLIDPNLETEILAAITLNEINLKLISVAGLKLLVDPDQTVLRAVAPAAEISEDDLALILNTSGTTGKPKRVGLTHRLLFNAATYDRESQQMTAADTTLITMPMFHINAQAMSVLSMRLAGGKIVVAPKFSASRFWQQVAENQVTWSSVVPTIITILLLNQTANEQYQKYQKYLKLRFVRSSSFALPEDKFRAFERRYHTQILEGYGMTETASQCTINPFDAPKIGSAGKPYKTEVGFLINGEITKAPNRIGEIAVRGDHVINDYLDSHQDSFRDGWFLTGDLGYFDEDGYLFVKGRIKEMISRGGEKVAPAAVENVLNQLDFIGQVAVIGLPDEIYGEAVTAVVIPKKAQTHDLEAEKQAIFDYAAEKLAKFQQPTQIYFVSEFPLNATGKVVRPKLHEELVQQLAGEAR
ncbi:AMP-binding protein [Lapidilactobacillus mulanensis]|uniref:AMP-binding protein n=1 Tax=Lapidilactobacillus mulanensis TaxID=2485999 RepID=A0ABW4DMZ7_9LACO|nr:AMP-binding protein [Lapidilactobacillus mulanensis]